MHRRLLVTGFGPFPGVPENPSGAAALAMHGAHTPSKNQSFQVIGATLATEWDRAWPQLAAAVGACAPHALIMLGVSRRPRIEVETVAHNRRAARRDAADALPEHLPGPDLAPICTHGPATILSTLPWARFETPTRAGSHAIATSSDAGDYLCNFIFYKAMHHLPGIGRRGFVHLPPDAGPAAGMAAVHAVVAALD
jgi:pyroglutamyl-peptidase